MQVKKSLGLWRLSALVTGNMMGSGMFMLPASLALYGSIGLLAWVVTALGAVCLALVFGRLTQIVPGAGGPYAFCRAAYGEFVGFQMAYCYWIAVWIGNTALLVAAVAAMTVFWPALGQQPLLALGVSLALLWLVTGINMLGVREAGAVQVVMTLAKLLPIVLLAVAGFIYMHPSNLLDFNISGKSNWQAFSATVTLTLWSFIGFESATVPREDAIDPKRHIPLATLLGTCVAALVYIMVTASIMGVVPMHELAQTPAPFATAAGQFWGSWGRYGMAAVAVVACVGTLNGWVLMQGQISMAVAKDQLFPSMFARQTASGTPAVGIAMGSVCISLLLILRYGASLVSQFNFIISLAVLASLIPYMYSALAEIALLFKDPDQSSQPQLKRAIILGSLGFIYAWWAVMGAEREVVYDGLLLFLSSVPVYLCLRWTRLKKHHCVSHHPELFTNKSK